MKPFLKWPGNKYSVRQLVLDQLPYGNRYVEPFVGAGAIFASANYPNYWINDSNQDLMWVYWNLQRHGELFVNACENYFHPGTNNQETFIAKRKLYNRLCTDHIHKSVLFVYLNRHCFNGLYRCNSQQKFNVPFGKYDKPYFPRTEMLLWRAKLLSTAITSIDFEEVLAQCNYGDVVYCDPPYYPTSNTANFTGYIHGWKHDIDHTRLLQAAQDARERGAYVVISNSDVEPIHRLYRSSGGRLVSHNAPGVIAAKASSRTERKELLLVLDPRKS